MQQTRGIALKIGSTICFTIMITLVKLASERLPLGQILFARAWIGLIPVLAYLVYRRQFPAGLATKRIGGHIWRGFIGFTGLVLWFGALARLPLPDAQAINYAGPLVAVVLSVILLGETVRLHRWSAVCIGFAGVVIILWEHMGEGPVLASDSAALGALMSLGAAVCAALAMIQVRNLTATERTAAIVFYHTGFAAVMTLFILPFGWTALTALDAAYLLGMGLIGGIGQVMMTEGYRHAEASVLAPFDYSNMVWVVIISIIVFGDVPSLTVAIGAVIVVGAGIFVTLRERHLEKRGKRPPKAPRQL